LCIVDTRLFADPNPCDLTFHSDSYVTLGCSGVTAVIAWCCLVYATAVCDFMQVKGTDPNGNTVTIDRGIWKTQGPSFDDTTCSNVSSSYKDSKWKAAEAMSVIGCIIGGFAILPLVCACGKKLRMSQTLAMSGGCIKACLFGGLTLLMKKSNQVCQGVVGLTNTKCELGDGARFAIAATVLFFVSAISINCAFARAVAEQEGGQGGGGAAATQDVEKGEEQ